MSAWSDAGWPAGIFFSRPFIAINLIIEAVNELIPISNPSLMKLPAISSFDRKTSLRETLRRIDRWLPRVMNAFVTDDNVTLVVADGDPFPQWVVDRIGGDVPTIPNIASFEHDNLLLRWVISRYKMLCILNRYAAYQGHWQFRGNFDALYKDYYNEQDRYDRVLYDWETGRSLESYTTGRIAATYWYDGRYCTNGMVSSRLLYHPSWSVVSEFPNPKIEALLTTGLNLPVYPVDYDASVLGEQGSVHLIRTGLSPVPSDPTIVIWDSMWDEMPYPIIRDQSTYRRGLSITAMMIRDITAIRRFYDPPEVWQNINA